MSNQLIKLLKNKNLLMLITGGTLSNLGTKIGYIALMAKVFHPLLVLLTLLTAVH